MAITNAQQYKQLVNPPMKGNKRPGYRGSDMGKEKGTETGRAGRDDREIGARMSRTQAAARANQRALAALGDPDPEVDVATKDRRDTITSFGKNLRANIRSNPFSILSPTMTFLKTAYQTGKARDLLGLTTNNDDDDTNIGGGEGENIIPLMATPYQQDVVEEAIEELSPIELALKQRDEMGGARAFAKEGGIMDLETGRQMYLFGKLVKKAKKIVGKITKSPIGKAALAFGAAKLGGGLFGTTKFGFMKPGSKFLSKVGGLGGLIKQKATDFGLYKAGEGLTGRGMLGLGAALTAAPLLFQKDDTEDEYAEFLRRTGRGPSINKQGIRNDPYSVLARGFYAEGGKPEPVAKKTMPLLDMGGQEMDLRAEGGFVPIGRMEKADDVPARLSKNEFVFTADAVRNAGDGDVDKGAEVMYNMMKNLEAGGEVSEESQGLKGARKMFQTSQRLEEVL